MAADCEHKGLFEDAINLYDLGKISYQLNIGEITFEIRKTIQQSRQSFVVQIVPGHFRGRQIPV